MTSSTPSPRGLCVTRSAASLRVSTALAVATAYSDMSSSAWSFSPSPAATTLRGDSPSSASACLSPLALLQPAGRHITAPLLKITCCSRPRLAIACSTTVSWGRMVARMVWPTDSGMPLDFSASMSVSGGGSPSSRRSPVSGR